MIAAGDSAWSESDASLREDFVLRFPDDAARILENATDDLLAAECALWAVPPV